MCFAVRLFYSLITYFALLLLHHFFALCFRMERDRRELRPHPYVLSLPHFSAEIRAQLVEQQKCLDQQTEMRVQLLQDLQDFFRKKAEIETEYSRNLEKLAERFMAKTRSTKDHQQYK